eukprot:9858556-Karenia_brevis.AAC.1
MLPARVEPPATVEDTPDGFCMPSNFSSYGPVLPGKSSQDDNEDMALDLPTPRSHASEDPAHGTGPPDPAIVAQFKE